MRTKLEKLGSKDRHVFIGTFERTGYKRGWKGYPFETVLLREIKLVGSDTVLTGHLWFNMTKGFEALDLHEGDTVRFDARVDSYIKGYVGRDEWGMYVDERTVDFKLSRPTKISKI